MTLMIYKVKLDSTYSRQCHGYILDLAPILILVFAAPSRNTLIGHSQPYSNYITLEKDQQIIKLTTKANFKISEESCCGVKWGEVTTFYTGLAAKRGSCPSPPTATSSARRRASFERACGIC